MGEGLELRDVFAGWGQTVILEGISLAVPSNGTLALLGRNGVGKSTLMRTVMGHTTLHGGDIRLNGVSIGGSPIHRRARAGLGFVPQEREIFPSLTVRENLTVAARGKRWTLDRVFDLFPNLAQRLTNMGNELSGGEQQMLAVARVLMCDPCFLLLDEPLEGLSPLIADALLAAIRRLHAEHGLGVILVEQHARSALDFAERVVILERGQVVHDGPSAALVADPDRLAELMGVAAHLPAPRSRDLTSHGGRAG